MAQHTATPSARAQARGRFAAMLDSLSRDVAYALRTLRRAPVAAATIVVTVGLGLGPYDSISLGKILNEAIRNEALTGGAWWAFMPAMVLVTVIAFSLYVINTAMEGVFNPRLRK
jgi:ABC-type dipeptide/oligopeptide/nickel transport system permease subunit